MAAPWSAATRYSRVVGGPVTVHGFALSPSRVTQHGKVVLTCSVCHRTDVEHERWARGSTDISRKGDPRGLAGVQIGARRTDVPG